MKWFIPAKTFLVGEYAAVAQQSAILLTTTPSFSLSLENEACGHSFHPESPAGLLLQHNKTFINCVWVDPYEGLGGLGASSAQFLASYLATCHLDNNPFDRAQLLKAYEACAWQGVGLKPSGYDVLAQSLQGCVYINQQKRLVETYPWPFEGLSFLLVHTGVKLATHKHLQESCLPSSVDTLSAIVEDVKKSFDEACEKLLIASINAYHKQLLSSKLVAAHSLELIETLKLWPEVLAIKGCGALGADVVLLLCVKDLKFALSQKLKTQGLRIIACEENLKKICENA